MIHCIVFEILSVETIWGTYVNKSVNKFVYTAI